MTETLCRKVAEAYAERVWNQKDLDAIDDLLHPQVTIHSLLGDFHGPKEMLRVVQAWLIGFPDLMVRNQHTIESGEVVCLHWSASGTHKGSFKGHQPTGRSVSYAGVSIYKVRDGKIVEYWAYLDMDHIIRQFSNGSP